MTFLSLVCLSAAALRAQAVFTALPSSVSVSYQPGGPAPALLPIDVTSTPSAAGFTAKVSGIPAPSWLSVSPGGGTTRSTIYVSILPAGLAPGAYSSSIVVTPAVGNGTPLSIPVSLTVAGDVPSSGVQITLDNTNLTFVHRSGNSAPGFQTIALTAIGGRADYQVQSSPSTATWLTVSPLSGTLQASTPQILTVNVNPAGLDGGTYTASIKVITAGGTTGNNVAAVTLRVAPPTLKLAPQTFAFTYRIGDFAPPPQTLVLTSSDTALAYSVSSSVPWLSATPAGGSTPANIVLSISPAGLSAGNLSGVVTVASSNASNPSTTIPVTLAVTQVPSLSVAPAAISFAAPADGTAPASQTLTVTSGGVPVPFTATVSGAPWLKATPSSATTPGTVTLSVNPGSLPIGTQQGTVTVASTAAAGGSKSVPVFLTLTTPIPNIAAVTHGATLATGPVAPGEIVTIFGTNLGPATAVAAQSSTPGFLDQSLAGATIVFDSTPAALVYVSASQASAIVPYSVSGHISTQVQVVARGEGSKVVRLDVADAVPGIFSADSSGRGAGAILNQDSRLNTPANPAAPGSIVILYATGEGQTAPPGIDGKLAVDPLPAPVLPVSVTIGGRDAKVVYAGAAPGLVAGVLQVNVQIPMDVTPGDAVLVQLTVGRTTSPAVVTVAVR